VELSLYVCLACALFYLQVINALGEKDILVNVYVPRKGCTTQPEWKHGLVATLNS